MIEPGILRRLEERGVGCCLIGAAAAPDVPAKVATPLALVLLKLEAGGTLDTRDVVALIEVQRVLNGAPWLDELAAEIPRLRSPARALWSRLAAELGIPSPRDPRA